MTHGDAWLTLVINHDRVACHYSFLMGKQIMLAMSSSMSLQSWLSAAQVNQCDSNDGSTTEEFPLPELAEASPWIPGAPSPFLLPAQSASAHGPGVLQCTSTRQPFKIPQSLTLAPT